VKILDFGLAKLIQPDLSATGASLLPTTPPQTTPGVVLGTTGYMSPEQVRGREADARADIFAFGAILYEMLGGRRAFGRETSMDTMSAILKEDPPPLDPLRRVPPALARIVDRCLEKDPAARFKSADDLAFALEALSGSTTAAVALVPQRRKWLMPAAGAAAVLALVALAFAAGQRLSGVPRQGDLTFRTLTFEPQSIFNARFAPDGETAIFSAALEGNAPQLFVSRANALAPQAIGVRAHLLSVSSKGELAVLIDPTFIMHRLFRGTLARMPIDGTPRPWLENVREADWSPDGSTLAIIRDDGRADRLEYPIGTVLYQAAGYLSDLRVSPDGTQVAFFEHQVRFDDRGWLKVVDRQSKARTLAGEYWGEEGIAWAPDGRTIFYSAGQAGWDAFYPFAVSASGSSAPRAALPDAAAIFIHDVSSKGRWLATQVEDYRSARALLPGEHEEREFPWLGSLGGGGVELSPDGKLLLFDDQSQSAGPNYAVAVRKVDGSPPVRLGEGYPAGFSPDGTKVLAATPSPPQLVVYPTGPGETSRIDPAPLKQADPRGWLHDGRVVFCGNTPAAPFRCYARSLTGGAAEQLTPDGFDVGPLSADGRTVVVIAPDGTRQLFSLADRQLRPLPGIAPADTVIGWRRDGSAVFVHTRPQIPAPIAEISLATGRRTPIRELAPPDRAGLLLIPYARVFDDGRGYSYMYWRRRSRLFTVTGITAPR